MEVDIFLEAETKRDKLISLGCTIYHDFNESIETRKE